MARVTWGDAPDDGDVAAASGYLSLLVADAGVRRALLQQLGTGSLEHYRGSDLLRAAGLPLLPADDAEVAAELRRVRKNRVLAPILLVRGDLAHGLPLHIVAGYQRVCASLHANDGADIACRLIDRPVRDSSAATARRPEPLQVPAPTPRRARKVTTSGPAVAKPAGPRSRPSAATEPLEPNSAAPEGEVPMNGG